MGGSGCLWAISNLLFIAGTCPLFPKFTFLHCLVLGLADSGCTFWPDVEYGFFVKKPELGSAFYVLALPEGERTGNDHEPHLHHLNIGAT